VLRARDTRASRGPDPPSSSRLRFAPLLLLDRSEALPTSPAGRNASSYYSRRHRTERCCWRACRWNALKFENEPTGWRSTARLTIVARVKDKEIGGRAARRADADLASRAGQALAGAGDILFLS
jgi:hypothetical protein